MIKVYSLNGSAIPSSLAASRNAKAIKTRLFPFPPIRLQPIYTTGFGCRPKFERIRSGRRVYHSSREPQYQHAESYRISHVKIFPSRIAYTHIVPRSHITIDFISHCMYVVPLKIRYLAVTDPRSSPPSHRR